MFTSSILKAEAEAERFLAAVRKLKSETGLGDFRGPHPDRTYVQGSKHTGAVKRASMDLTRALADMRADRQP